MPRSASPSELTPTSGEASSSNRRSSSRGLASAARYESRSCTCCADQYPRPPATWVASPASSSARSNSAIDAPERTRTATSPASAVPPSTRSRTRRATSRASARRPAGAGGSVSSGSPAAAAHSVSPLTSSSTSGPATSSASARPAPSGTKPSPNTGPKDALSAWRIGRRARKLSASVPTLPLSASRDRRRRKISTSAWRKP